NGALSDAHPCQGGWLRLFIQPPGHDPVRLRDRDCAARFRHDGRIRFHCLMHARSGSCRGFPGTANGGADTRRGVPLRPANARMELETMTMEINVLAATGVLGAGFKVESLDRGIGLRPTFIACDAGSTD